MNINSVSPMPDEVLDIYTRQIVVIPKSHPVYPMLDEVLDYYEKQGVIIPKPKLFYSIHADHREYDDYRVEAEIVCNPKFIEFCSVALNDYKYSLLTPEQADKAKSLYRPFYRNDTIPEGSIQLHKPFFDLWIDNKLEILAHELWHLHEINSGLIFSHPHIFEGTAYYAGRVVLEEITGKKFLPYKEIDFSEFFIFKTIAANHFHELFSQMQIRNRIQALQQPIYR